MRPAQWLGLGPGICRLLVPLYVGFTGDVNSRWPADRHSVCVNQRWAITGQALEQAVVVRTRHHMRLRVLRLVSQRGSWDGPRIIVPNFNATKRIVPGDQMSLHFNSCRQGHSAAA
jgi:hypothetical protein